MEPLHSITIPPTKTARLRVGIKWDPLERDDIGNAYGVESAEEARAELGETARQIKNTALIKKILKWTVFLEKQIEQIDRSLDQIHDKKKALEKYLTQEKLPSYDLDLCCFCYGVDGKLIKFVSPVTMEAGDDLRKKPAFMHTGDATTGTGGVFDEEILVDMKAMDPEVATIFFVTVSVNHGFHQIKGGFWSIISTKDEDQLLSVKMETAEPLRVHVMARLSRGDGVWKLDEIATFCPIAADKKIPLQGRIDQMIVERYLSGEQAPSLPAL